MKTVIYTLLAILMAVFGFTSMDAAIDGYYQVSALALTPVAILGVLWSYIDYHS